MSDIHPMKKIMFLLPVFLFSGCASFSSKFKEGHGVNFGPFADQTVTILSSLNYELSPNELFLIRPYVDLNSPDVKKLKDNVQLERDFLKGIIAYSIEIVNLSEAGMSPADQVKAYRDYVSSLAHAAKNSDGSPLFPDDKTEKMVADIGQKATLLEAMQGARPLILEFNQVNLRLIREISTMRSDLVKKIQVSIDERFYDFVQLDQVLRRKKAALARRLSASSGANDKALTDQMIAIKKRQEVIQPDLDTYRELKLKMDAMAVQHDDMIRAGGRAVLLWSQAHQKMANGVTNPAEWFSMGDVKNALLSSGKKAIP